MLHFIVELANKFIRYIFLLLTLVSFIAQVGCKSKEISEKKVNKIEYATESTKEYHADLGTNSESIDFAKDMTDLARVSCPKCNIVWQLELEPKTIKGDIVAYRKSVTYCKATITLNNNWLKQTAEEKKYFIESCINVLHKSPLISTSGVIDYYPNSSGEVTLLVGNKVVATGNYTKTEFKIFLKPSTNKRAKRK